MCTTSFILLLNNVRFFFFPSFRSIGSRKKDQRRRAEGGQTEDDGHGTQEDRRTLPSAVRAIGVLFDERPQQTAGALLARRRHRQGNDRGYYSILPHCFLRFSKDLSNGRFIVAIRTVNNVRSVLT